MDAHTFGSLMIQILALGVTVVGAAVALANRFDRKIDAFRQNITADMKLVINGLDNRLRLMEKEHWEMRGRLHPVFSRPCMNVSEGENGEES